MPCDNGLLLAQIQGGITSPFLSPRGHEYSPYISIHPDFRTKNVWHCNHQGAVFPGRAALEYCNCLYEAVRYCMASTPCDCSILVGFSCRYMLIHIFLSDVIVGRCGCWDNLGTPKQTKTNISEMAQSEPMTRSQTNHGHCQLLS